MLSRCLFLNFESGNYILVEMVELHIYCKARFRDEKEGLRLYHRQG